MSKVLSTWKELKDFCNSLSDEQLLTPFKIEITEQPYKKTVFGYVSPDDYLVNAGDPEDYGYKNEMSFDDGLTVDDYVVLYKKGEPVLSCDN